MITILVLTGVGLSLVIGAAALWGATLNARDRGELPPVPPWRSIGDGLAGCSGCSYLILAAAALALASTALSKH